LLQVWDFFPAAVLQYIGNQLRLACFLPPDCGIQLSENTEVRREKIARATWPSDVPVSVIYSTA
jgi:hypothetical protein